MPSAGAHSQQKFWFRAAPLASGDPPRPHVTRRAGAAMEVTMTLVDIALWFILAALIAIVPIGCVMTRSGKSGRHPAPE
jgi:hypothetical protein